MARTMKQEYNAAYMRAWRAANPDKAKAELAAWRAANREHVKEYCRVWHAANREEEKAYRVANREKHRVLLAAWRAANPEKVQAYADSYRAKTKARNAARYVANREKLSGQQAKWRAANPDKARARVVRYLAKKLQRTVVWYDRLAVEDLYHLAYCLTRATGVLHVVDHIIPLQGRLVSGLHVEHNLQVMVASDNCSKCNDFDPDEHEYFWVNDEWQRVEVGKRFSPRVKVQTRLTT